MWWYWVIDGGGLRTALDVAFEARNARELEALALKTVNQAREASYVPKYRIYHVLSLTALDEGKRKVYPAGMLPPRARDAQGRLLVNPDPTDDETIIRRDAGLWWEKAEFAFSYREELQNPP